MHSNRREEIIQLKVLKLVLPWTIWKKGTESNSLILQSKNRDTKVLSSTGDNRLTQTRLFSPGIIPFYSSYCSEKIQHANGFPVLESSQMSCQRRQWHPTSVLLPGKPQGRGSLVGCSPRGRRESETTERLRFHFPALEKEMATHSSVLAWRIPGTGEPGGLPSMGPHRVGHD